MSMAFDIEGFQLRHVFKRKNYFAMSLEIRTLIAVNCWHIKN